MSRVEVRGEEVGPSGDEQLKHPVEEGDDSLGIVCNHDDGGEDGDTCNQASMV